MARSSRLRARLPACTNWYMITQREIEIAAPIELVWERYTDVERWPEWTASVNALRALDSAELALGNRYEIRQPRMPALTWAVTELTPGRSWSWEQVSPGGRTIGFHEMSPIDVDRTRVRLGVDQRGPVGRIFAVAFKRTTNRFLDLESAGLQAHCEARHRAGA